MKGSNGEIHDLVGGGQVTCLTFGVEHANFARPILLSHGNRGHRARHHPHRTRQNAEHQCINLQTESEHILSPRSPFSLPLLHLPQLPILPRLHMMQHHRLPSNRRRILRLPNIMSRRLMKPRLIPHNLRIACPLTHPHSHHHIVARKMDVVRELQFWMI